MNITQENYFIILLSFLKSIKIKKIKGLLCYTCVAFRRELLGKELANFLIDFNKSLIINILEDSSKKKDIYIVSWL